MTTTEIRKGVTVAGRYRVLRRLGAGGMATVFLAEDERLGRQVALKRLHGSAPEESVRRLDREARLGAALNHPSLVAIFDTFATDEGALIVMEYVPGRSLSEQLRGKPIRARRALEILHPVAEALDHAHAEGVVHRDVKPSNVLVGDDGQVKLADLGIARAIDETQITREGQVVGTLPYMAPERFEGPGRGTPESDVYSLAAVAFELLAGSPPRPATGTGDVDPGPPDLRRQWPDGSAPVQAVLERGLDPDPGRRPATAGRFVEELEAALERDAEPDDATVPLAAAEDRRRRPAPAPARQDGPSRRTALAALAGALALVLAAVVLSAGDGDDSAGGERGAGAEAPAGGKGEAPEPVPAPVEEEPADAPEGGDPALGAQLNDEGFALIGKGRYEEAVPILERAVASFPEGTGDINYAFALFNLGNALRLAGRPEEAIPVLERRLEIPNQTGTVRRELELARQEAGD